MTQYVRPALAYSSVAATVATVASAGSIDQKALHKRFVDSVGLFKGTTQYGTMRLFNTTERHLAIPDSVYSALVTAGVSFADAQYNSSTAAGAYTNTSEIPILWNPGLHKQVVFMVGDSITNSATGAGTYPDLNTLSNKLWSQPNALIPSLRKAYTSESIVNAPDRSYTGQWTNAASRLVFNFGRDSWRLANQSGFTYTTGSPWVDNIAHMAGLSLHASQQHSVVIFCGTNDIKHANDSGNPGLAAVPGTSPNYIDNALTPFITAFKAIYPTAKIVFVTPIARVNSSTLNTKFDSIATYVVANRAALNIDVVVDTRTLPDFDCRTPTVVTNATYYQPDEVHLTPAANPVLGAAIKTALDGLL